MNNSKKVPDTFKVIIEGVGEYVFKGFEKDCCLKTLAIFALGYIKNEVIFVQISDVEILELDKEKGVMRVRIAGFL